MDFFTVPTLTFGALYCFFIISHDRRRILHFNITRRPTSPWIAQQLRRPSPSMLFPSSWYSITMQSMDSKCPGLSVQ
jgi:hypothetical protein